MGLRFYAPGLGRFLSRDPSGFTAGANLYAYCAGDPINFFDATGCGPQGLGDWIDGHLMGGATSNFGNTAGRYDAGKATPGQVLMAGAQWGLGVGGLALSAYGVAAADVAGHVKTYRFR
jgi:uncharacterized protein RhaS with RHS repeats